MEDGQIGLYIPAAEHVRMEQHKGRHHKILVLRYVKKIYPLSVTCFFRMKTRECINPKPQFDGSDCFGDSIVLEQCDEQECKNVQKAYHLIGGSDFNCDKYGRGHLKVKYL